MLDEHIKKYCESVKTWLGWYTVGLVRVKDDPTADNLLGSGRLVRFNNEHAILTAQHVVADLRHSSKFALGISEYAHRLVWQKEHTEIIEIGRLNVEHPEQGPDLAVIKLLGHKLGTIKAKKSFYDLRQMVNGSRIKPVDYGSGLFLSGSVGEWTREGGPKGGFCGVKSFCGLTGAVGAADKYWQRDNFDFCQLTVKQNCDDNPTNYQGLSGGGLWKALVKNVVGPTCEVQDVILCGVPYWQTDMNNNQRRIICHAYKSIYGPVCHALESNTH